MSSTKQTEASSEQRETTGVVEVSKVTMVGLTTSSGSPSTVITAATTDEGEGTTSVKLGITEAAEINKSSKRDAPGDTVIDPEIVTPSTPAATLTVSPPDAKRSRTGDAQSSCEEQVSKNAIDTATGTKNNAESSVVVDSSPPVSSSVTAASPTDAAEDSGSDELLDLAETFGLKPGDRLEVLWEVGDDVEGDENVKSHWWGATLLEHDGRYEDSVAIRVLDYDPFPDGGYPERSKEDVIFIRHDTLMDYDTHGELQFRKEGEEGSDIYFGRSQIEDVVNATLENAFQKNSSAWNNLDAAQKAKIAELIAEKKEKLMKLLLSHEGCVVTSNDMKSILAQTMSG